MDREERLKEKTWRIINVYHPNQCPFWLDGFMVFFRMGRLSKPMLLSEAEDKAMKLWQRARGDLKIPCEQRSPVVHFLTMVNAMGDVCLRLDLLFERPVDTENISPEEVEVLKLINSLDLEYPDIDVAYVGDRESNLTVLSVIGLEQSYDRALEVMKKARAAIRKNKPMMKTIANIRYPADPRNRYEDLMPPEGEDDDGPVTPQA